MNYQFVPHPQDVKWFKDKYIQWKAITRDFDFVAILNVIKLWNGHDEKETIAKMIEKSIVSSNYFIGKNVNLVQPILDMLARYQMPETSNLYVAEESIGYNSLDKKATEIEQLKEEKATLQNRISELEAENERLKALQETKKKTGTARKFTLVEIVDYCKGCVEWNDAKFIVAMLNKLLRHTGTTEDSDLVDSIEDEFKNRVYGNVTMQNPHFEGAMYDISGNTEVKIGGVKNGE